MYYVESVLGQNNRVALVPLLDIMSLFIRAIRSVNFWVRHNIKFQIIDFGYCQPILPPPKEIQGKFLVPEFFFRSAIHIFKIAVLTIEKLCSLKCNFMGF